MPIAVKSRAHPTTCVRGVAMGVRRAGVRVFCHVQVEEKMRKRRGRQRGGGGGSCSMENFRDEAQGEDHIVIRAGGTLGSVRVWEKPSQRRVDVLAGRVPLITSFPTL